MKILVTGGAGFIGSHLVDKLLIQKNQVFCLDNLSTGLKENIFQHSSNKNFKFIYADLANRRILEKLVKESDLIFHLAAVVGVTNVLKNPILGIHTNSGASSKLIDLAYQYRKKLLFTSSSECYGKNPNKVFKESSNSVFGPPTITRWWYAVSKLLEEHLLLSYAKLGLKNSVVRLFNIYGPRSNNPIYSNVIPKFIKQSLSDADITVYGNGRQVRSFTYVEDAVNAIIALSISKPAQGEVVNVGRSEPISILSLAKRIKKVIKSKSKIKFVKTPPDFEETQFRVPDSTKLYKLTKYNCNISLEEGLERTLEWFKNQH